MYSPIKTGINCRELSIVSRLNHRFRASIALLLIVGITCQLCLFVNQFKYTYTTDQAIEKLVKFDPLDDDHVNLDEFIPNEIVIPSAENHLQLTLYKYSRLFLGLASTYSIRSPPSLS